jgi:hypothetical protein
VPREQTISRGTYQESYITNYTSIRREMGAPGRSGVADGGAERAHPLRLLRDMAFGIESIRSMGFQGYLAREKHPTTQDHRRSLGIGLL